MSYVAKMFCKSRAQESHKYCRFLVCDRPRRLRGEADADHDGWITLGELYNFAKPKVADESQRLGYA